VDVFPDGVAYPSTGEEVRELMGYAQKVGAVVIPYGGGTSVVGHITPQAGGNPILTVDLGRMNRLIALDDRSRTATFGPGAAGPEVEAQLRAHRYTLGHYPQSFEFSTLGGWVATRSTGQCSLGYGRIEQLFAGGRMETPSGTLILPPFPASAAGPDLRELVLGSEGRMGVLTEVVVRIRPLPEHEQVRILFFPDWDSGLKGVRRAVQKGLPLTMMRLSSPRETETQLVLAGNPRLVGLLKGFLGRCGAGEGKSMVTLGADSSSGPCRRWFRSTQRIMDRTVGNPVGRYLGRQWLKHRFLTPYLRNALWEHGYGVDTFESAAGWDKVEVLMARMEGALESALQEEEERVHVFSHLSHLYPQGASIYTTCIFRLDPSFGRSLERWRRLKAAVSEAIVSGGGTISHQHGVGTDHAPYLKAEKGALGIGAIQRLVAHFDPSGMMNPGKLVR
jgi:alkyldihydroxyacetonephosphate synthase